METVLWIALAAEVGLIILVVLVSDRLALSNAVAADLRAEKLLLSLLSEEYYNLLRTAGYLEVRSRLVPSRVYRIRRRGPVEVHELGRFRMYLCLKPLHPLPCSDVVLLHKVLLEGDEQRYIETANVIKPCGSTSLRSG